MVPIGCLDTAGHAFNAGAATVTPADASMSRPLAAHFGDVKVADDFGPPGSGAAIQAAIDAAAASRAGTVLVPAGDWTVATTLDLKTGVTLQMSAGALLRPGANVDIVALRPGAACLCRIDTSGFAGWNKVAIDVDGDANAAAVPYRLHTPTRIDAELIGATGAGAGTAVRLHADGVANARVMGVEARVRVSGFAKGYWLRQTSTDLSKFVNGNRLDGFFSATLQSLVMESAHVNGYGLDGNQFWIQHQPLPGTTVPAMTIAGQQNEFDLLPWDWDGVVGTSPYAVVAQAHLRTSRITLRSDPAYLQWSTIDRTNQLMVLNANGGLYVDHLRARGADGVVQLTNGHLRFDNDYGIVFRNADGSIATKAIYSDPAATYLRSTSGTDVIVDVNKAGGLLAIRMQNANAFYANASTWSPAVTEGPTLGSVSARWGAAYVTTVAHKVYTVATLPNAGGRAGFTAFASDARKVGEASGAGTGVLVYSDGVAWRRVSDDTTVGT
ncbi:MAG: hypothetical protein Q7J32_11765 [Sphingomonadaceae bacterium]|nr:hypothetical protein [Sphingomonadaceae bacterium]